MTFHHPVEPLTVDLVTRRTDVLRVRLGGDLDYDTTHELHEALDEVLDEVLDGSTGRRQVVLDCSGLETCDSTGLSALLMIRRRVHDAGARLRLVGRPPVLRRLLAVTGTEEHFGGPNDRDEVPQSASLPG